MSTPQFIYVMKDLRKVVPPNREILKGIWLSFYPGAKIGVVGPNGAGKSTVLRIMAGVDTNFQGESWPAKGTRIGYLPQEPQLDPGLNVRGNVEEAVKAQRAVLTRFDEINLKFAEPMSDDEMTALIDDQARVQDQIDAGNLWDLDRKIDIAMEALRLPPPDAAVEHLSGGERVAWRSAKYYSRSPTCCFWMSRPTIWMLNRSLGWSSTCNNIKGTVIAVTHDRYFLDNVAGWILELDRGRGHSLEGKLLILAGTETRTAGEGREKPKSKRQKTLSASWSGFACLRKDARRKAKPA